MLEWVRTIDTGLWQRAFSTKRSTKLCQRQHGQQINAYERLYARNGPYPTRCLQYILIRLQARYPVAYVDVTHSDVKC